MPMRPDPTNKGLGRRHAPDMRDRQFLLPRPKAPLRELPITSKYWMSTSPILDQGETSQCVIYSGDKLLTTGPVVNKGFGTNAERERIYKIVQTMDEWPGEDYDGTSVRAMMKYLKSKGQAPAYAWAFDHETAVNHLLTTGPLQLGTNWYVDMFFPDAHGYVTPGGQLAGGHAYVAIGANRNKLNPDGTKGAVQCVNSWGSSWGVKGRFWMTFGTLERLIAEDGEAATPSEVKVAV